MTDDPPRDRGDGLPTRDRGDGLPTNDPARDRRSDTSASGDGNDRSASGGSDRPVSDGNDRSASGGSDRPVTDGGSDRPASDGGKSDEYGRVAFDAEAAADESRIPEEYRSAPTETTEETGSAIRELLSGIRSNRKALFGLIVVVGFVSMAVFAPLVAPHPPDKQYDALKPPNSFSEGDFDGDGETERAYHLLGTGSFGKDLFSRIVFGARVSLLVAFATMALAFVVGTAIGIVSGYYGGWIDTALQRVIDFQWAFPELILAVAIIAFFGGRGVLNVVIAIGIAYIDDFARLIRGEVLSIREEEYVRAAEAVGMSDVRIMVREVFPNAFAPLIVQATIMIPLAILAEASLSFLGLGVSPTTPTWGILINLGYQFFSQAPGLSVFPGIAIAIVVLGFNMFGDGLRDIFDISEGEVAER